MLPGFSSKIAGAATPAMEPPAHLLTPSTHLLSIVQRILSVQDNTQITLPGMGTISIFPQRREYHADVENMETFCTSSAADFEIRILDRQAAAAISPTGKDVRDLLWQLAFYIYQDNLIEGCSENDVIQFSRWPNLTRLPTTPNTARISALLTRHPTSVTLVRRILGIDKSEVNRVISAAISAGIVNTVSHAPSLANPDSSIAETKAEQPQKPSLWNSLFAKISSL